MGSDRHGVDKLCAGRQSLRNAIGDKKWGVFTKTDFAGNVQTRERVHQ